MRKRMSEDAVEALKKCAEALHLGNRELANSWMKIVLDLAELETHLPTRRLIRYFAEALARRAYGLHPKYSSSLSLFDWKYKMCDRHRIFSTVGRTISNVIKGKSKVHVIDLADHKTIFYQWRDIICSVYKWVDLRHLRLSVLVQENIEFVKENEEYLIRAAKYHHIELEYEIIAVNSWAEIDLTSLEMRRGEEFVVVNCMFVLSKILSVEKVLVTVRDVIKPDIMIVVDHDHDANHNQSDFLLRFDESLKYYSSLLLEDGELSVGVESYFKYQICNIVACEGSNRVERHQTRAQWESLLIHYGFSIHYLPTECENEDEDGDSLLRLENGILVIRSAETEKQPLFFVSGWTITSRPLKSSGSNNEGPCLISSESHRLQTFQIFPEDLYLIHMASLAEIYDMLLNISKQYEKLQFLVWAAYLHDESNSPLKPILRVEDVACFFNCYWSAKESLLKAQLKEGDGYVGKALKYNQPFYVPDINFKSKSEENVCPYLQPNYKVKFRGALAIKFSNAYTNCGNYVVEFLFSRDNMALEKQKQLVDCIINDLKNTRPRFVTYGNQDPPVGLAVQDTAVSNTMLVTGNNPPSQSTSDFNLNGTNQRVGNAVDVQWPMQQSSFVDQHHDTVVLDSMLTQDNLPSQPMDAFGLNGKPLIVVNPRDENVLQMPHEQGPPVELRVSATSNTMASRENLMALPIGDFNLNEKISSSVINQTIGYDAMDKQGPHKQGTKRRRTSKSDVWDHFEKEEVVDGELLAKCKYCEFKTDGSSKKGTSHLRKHFLSRHKTIKSVHHSSNHPSKNLETQSILTEKSVLDQDKIHMDVAKMIIKYKLPLSAIQDEIFKKPFRRLRPEFELQSKNDLGLSILHLYKKEKEKLLRYLDKLPCSFNLIINLWEEDAKKIVDCCLTVQFIDDGWALKKKILSFERLKHDFDVVSLCEIFKRVLLDWNIEEKTCSLTIHNSLSNVEIIHDEKIWPSGIFYLSYDKCIRDINCLAADISLNSIYEVYKKMNHQESRGCYTLMNAECSNSCGICSLILAIVAVLHPFLKLDFVEFVYKEIYGDATAKEHLDKISNFLRSVYDEYASNGSRSKNFTTAFGDTSCSSLSNAKDEVLESFTKYKASKRSPREFHQYLGKDEVSSMEIDILNWWCNNSSRFPTLGKIARDFLAIPLSTIVSSSAFAKEITKIISIIGDQETQIINAMICCQDWLESTETSACDEKCDEKLMREWREWSKKYLLWDFTREDFELLGKWKNSKMTGQRVGLDEKFKVQDKFLAPLVIPLVDAIIQATPQVYYIADEVVNTYFLLLTKRSEENPKVFLKHSSLDSSLGSFLLSGAEPSVPSWINHEEQINACKLLLPLCFSDHWTLFYVDIKDQKFVWLNPLAEMPKPNNFERVREWFEGSLLPAVGLNNAREWPLVSPRDIPKQQNGIDCGIFVMKYADCLTHANCIGFPFSPEDMPSFRERIFLDIYNGRIHVPENLLEANQYICMFPLFLMIFSFLFQCL